MDLQLRNKVALISGGSKGIGFSTARAFAKEGCNLAICSRNEAEVREAKEELEEFGVRVIAVQADVCQPESTESFVEQSAKEFGRIDFLVNNVGGGIGGSSILSTTDDDWISTFELNLFQVIRLIRTVVPYVSSSKGGAIVNVSSISGWLPQLAGSPQYGAAKAALIFLTERIALELVGCNIRVNTVSPSSIQNTRGWDQFKHQNPESFANYVKNGFPMGRLGYPEEIADVIVYLCSPRANWINGRHIPVDGLEQPVPVAERRPW